MPNRHQQIQKARSNGVWRGSSICVAKRVSEGGLGHLRHGLRSLNWVFDQAARQCCAGATHRSRLHHQRTRRSHSAHKHGTRRPVPDRRRPTRYSTSRHGLKTSSAEYEVEPRPLSTTPVEGGLLEQAPAAADDHRVMLGSGALARVVLQARNRRLYAELRWQIDKKQHSRYFGELTAANRASNFAAGWQHAQDLGLTISDAVASKSVRT